jgi:hypothetical protein
LFGGVEKGTFLHNPFIFMGLRQKWGRGGVNRPLARVGPGLEVADVPVTRERGHGQAEGFAGTALGGGGLDGLGHDGFSSCGLFGPAILIVRRRSLIICMRGHAGLYKI